MMKSNRRSFWQNFFSCKTDTTVVPYRQGNQKEVRSTSVIENNEDLDKIEENQVNQSIDRTKSNLLNDNLLADVNIDDALNLYELQVDALSLEESPLLIDAFKKCIHEKQFDESNGPLKILDIGCGTGELLIKLFKTGGTLEKMIPDDIQISVVGIELDPSIYTICQKRVRDVKHKKNIQIIIYNENATKLSFNSNEFHLILNRHMLHCIPKAEINFVIDEVYRVLKPNGIAHFLVEDIEMIYTSVDNDRIVQEQHELWSKGIYGTGKQLGVDLRFGRKLPSLLQETGFLIQSIKYAVVDTHFGSRETLINIFQLWHKMYLDIWKHNKINFMYGKYFENFIEVVQNKHEYVCWHVPIIQATKLFATGSQSN